MTCPWCAQTFPPLVDVRGLTICPHCLHTCALTADGGRKADGNDLAGVTDAEIEQLRAAKKRLRAAPKAGG